MDIDSDGLSNELKEESAEYTLKKSSFYKMAEKMSLKTGSRPRLKNLLYAWAWMYFEEKQKAPDYAEIKKKANSISEIIGEKGVDGTTLKELSSDWIKHFVRDYDIYGIGEHSSPTGLFFNIGWRKKYL